MANYEIMVIVNGTLSEDKVKKTIANLKDLLKKTEKLEVNNLGLKDLSYAIKKVNKGFYYTFNFLNSDTSVIFEFKRKAQLDKDILRFLIINLEKDYGYKSLVNPKKIAKSAYRAEKYKKTKEKVLAEQERIKKERDSSPVKLTDI